MITCPIKGNTPPARAYKVGDLAVVVGAGRSGRAAARLLHKHGARVRVVDASPVADASFLAWAEQNNIAIVCGEHRPEDFEGARLVVPSPGVPLTKLEPYFSSETPPVVMGEMELAWRELSGEPILAVTGTSGKTTTVSLCASMLEEHGYTVFLGGNIGTPLSEYILDDSCADVLVIEISSFQLQTCSSFQPNVAMLLNITENHLDYHADMAEYIEAKMRLFRWQQPEDRAIWGEHVASVVSRYAPQLMAQSEAPKSLETSESSYGMAMQHGSQQKQDAVSQAKLGASPSDIVERGGDTTGVNPTAGTAPAERGADASGVNRTVYTMPTVQATQIVFTPCERFTKTKLFGKHNQANMEAAWQAVRLFGVTEEEAARAVASFAPMPNRLELVADTHDILFVNDSKCTTVSSLRVALEAFDRPILLLAGGKFKGGDLAGLCPLVREKVRAVGLFGASRERFESAWGDVVPMWWEPTLEKAVTRMAAEAQRGDVVLMAPATASFDLFSNYEHRGEVFRTSVKALAW